MIKQLIINGKKSYEDFNVYIASRNISSPKKKSIKETVPFTNTVYDFSNINGEIYWEERTLQYTFDIAELSTEEMEEEKSKLLNWLLNVHDTDIYDPYIGDYHFHGSYNSDSWSEDFGAGTISVTFSVYPYKISNSDSNVIEEIGVSDDGTLTNSVAGYVQGLTLYGASEQNETPTPTNPIDVQTIKGIKNLYDKSNIFTGYINSSGEVVEYDGWSCSDYIEINPNEDYTYQGLRIVGISPSTAYYDENKTFISYFKQAQGINVITTPENAKYIRFSVINGSEDVIEIDSFMFEEGSVPHSYVPYGGDYIKVRSTKKNLFDVSKFVLGTNSDYYSLNEKNELLVNAIDSRSLGFSYYIDIKRNTNYTLSFSNSARTTSKIRVYNSNVGILANNQETNILTFNSGSSSYIAIKFVETEGYPINLGNVQLEEGTEATTYEEYQESNCLIDLQGYELCSVGDSKDKLQVVKNQIQLIKNVGKIIFDGSERWVISDGGFYTPSTSGIIKSKSNLLSDKYVYTEKTWQGNYTIAINTIGYVAISDDTYTTEEDFDNWIVQNNVTIYHEMIEPEIIVLGELETLNVYDSVSYVQFINTLDTTFKIYYNEPKTITITNNSSHRISPTITSTGEFTITYGDNSYSVGEGTYTNTFYLESGDNTLTLNGYGEITFSYVEEVF